MAMLKISTNKLMLVAGIVWAIAGANIANIGTTGAGSSGRSSWARR